MSTNKYYFCHLISILTSRCERSKFRSSSHKLTLPIFVLDVVPLTRLHPLHLLLARHRRQVVAVNHRFIVGLCYQLLQHRCGMSRLQLATRRVRILRGRRSLECLNGRIRWGSRSIRVPPLQRSGVVVLAERLQTFRRQVLLHLLKPTLTNVATICAPPTLFFMKVSKRANATFRLLFVQAPLKS